MDEITLSSCKQSDKEWLCPDRSCRKVLVRKQTLLAHIKSFHHELYRKIGVEERPSSYKIYESDPTAPVPRSTSHWRNVKEQAVNRWLTGDQTTNNLSIPEQERRGQNEGNNDNDRVFLPSDILPTDSQESESDMDLSWGSADSELGLSDSELDANENTTHHEETTGPNLSNPPLYVVPPQDQLYVSEITQNEHVLTVGAFSTRHNLSNAAIADLLDLLKLHVPESNLGLKSVNELKEECGFGKDYLHYNLYCSICKKLFENTDGDCPTPGCTGSSLDKEHRKYFVTSDISRQLREILERPGIWISIKESMSSTPTESICDIKSGLAYRELTKKGNFLHGNDNITLSLFTDGIPLFKSSGVSLWPVYLLINELPPKKRFHRQNMVLWGIWQGPGKPKMNMFLKPFVLDMTHLYRDGFTHTPNDRVIRTKVKLIVATMDLQARAMLLNMTHHNGQYGCLYCLEPGVTLPSGEGFCRAYPQREMPAEARTEKAARDSAAKARITGVREDGFFGESVFMYLPDFSVTENVVIDYMHGILLGICKKLLQLWFDTKHKMDPWFIGKEVKAIDKRLLGIKPPYFIHRKPRQLQNNYQHWKASELRNWLLFYGIPCMKDFLPDVYLTHFSCLSEATYILLGEGLSASDLNRADILMKAFVANVETVYGKHLMSLNVHNLSHITSFVRQWGPLWGFSCFPFESFNGEIKRAIHGTGNVCRDVFWYLQAEKRVERKVASLDTKEQATKSTQFLQKITGSSKHAEENYLTDDQCLVKSGEEIKRNFEEPQKHQLMEIFGTDKKENFLRAKKIIRNGNVFFIKESGRAKKQNSYTALLNQVEGACAMEIHTFLVYKESKEVWVYGKLLQATESILQNRLPHIQKLQDIGEYRLLRVSTLGELLVVMEMAGQTYGAIYPNRYERD